MATSSAANSSSIDGSPNGWTPIPTLAVAAPTSRPKISQTQISAEWVGSSPKPIIHRATMFAGSSIARQRTSNTPYRGV